MRTCLESPTEHRSKRVHATMWYQSAKNLKEISVATAQPYVCYLQSSRVECEVAGIGWLRLASRTNGCCNSSVLRRRQAGGPNAAKT